MGKTDALTKSLLSDNAEFAALFNYVLYNGEQVIKPGELEELDPQQHMVIDPESGALAGPLYRDIFKRILIRRDGQAQYCYLGIENQTHVDWAMVFRSLMYDMLGYGIQVNEFEKRQKVAGRYTSRMWHKDHLSQIFTVVVYYGNKPWDAPLSFRELFDVQNPILESFLPDYRMTLITPDTFRDGGLDMLGRNLGSVMYYLQARKSKSKLKEYINNAGRFGKLLPEAAMLLKELMNLKINIANDSEETDMCRAMTELLKDERREGRAEGIAVGKAEGIAVGKAEGMAVGKAEGMAVGKAEGRAEGIEEERANLLQKVLTFFQNNSYPRTDTIKMGKEVFNLNDKEIDGLLSRLNAKPGAELA